MDSTTTEDTEVTSVDAVQIGSPPARGRAFGAGRKRRFFVVGGVVAIVIAASIVNGRLWSDHLEVRRSQELVQQYLQAARQGVLDLTSISADTVDADTARVLDASTGSFADEFRARIADFASVVKQADVTAVGTITEAGIETMDGDTATALVAATSKVTNSAGAQEEPRTWRLRVTLANENGNVLISNVEFVP